MSNKRNYEPGTKYAKNREAILAHNQEKRMEELRELVEYYVNNLPELARKTKQMLEEANAMPDSPEKEEAFVKVETLTTLLGYFHEIRTDNT